MTNVILVINYSPFWLSLRFAAWTQTQSSGNHDGLSAAFLEFKKITIKRCGVKILLQTGEQGQPTPIPTPTNVHKKYL